MTKWGIRRDGDEVHGLQENMAFDMFFMNQKTTFSPQKCL
jgi:hypothetical protein